ncbi:MAG: TIGR00268 family protein [Methanomethylophilus alvi]|nr:MAG: TIGR00268 family protein [Methanomethylophilus alvi]
MSIPGASADPDAAVPESLRRFLAEHPRPAIAFSGGADSSYLLYAAASCGADAKAYFVKSAFVPEFERGDAVRTAKELGVPLEIISADILADPALRANPADRCYICKKKVFGAVRERADRDGRAFLMDATNASDDPNGRPGMRALPELEILSPLRECGLTKPEIRRLSHEAGLWTWNLPSYSCLATRVPEGMLLTEDILAKTERAENGARALGFSDIRIRARPDGTALAEITEEQQDLLERVRPEFESLILRYYSGIEYGIRRPHL